MKLFYNGIIHTMDPDQPQVEAVLTNDKGQIEGIGTIKNLSLERAQKINLNGRTLLPGFNDAHIHVSWLGLQLTLWIDARNHVAPDIPTILKKFEDRAANTPADVWLQGMGYNEALLAEGRHLNKTDLDQASQDHPIFLVRSCGHIAVVNSRALEMAGITAETADPPGGVIGRDERGEPTGILQETAMTLAQHLIPEPSLEEKITAVQASINYLLTLGVTAATDPDVMPEWLDVYKQMDRDNQLKIRLNLLASRRSGDQIIPLPSKYLSHFLRLDSVKFFADGGMTSATAAISIPYRETGTKGVLIYEKEELADLMWEAHSNGFRIGTHANGDVTIEQVLSIYELLHQKEPRPDLRHRIEHLALPTAGHLERAAKLGVTVATQPVFLPAMGATYRRYMPEQYFPRAYGIRNMLDAGLTVALSTDAPVVPDANPLLGIKAAIDRLDHAGNPLGKDQAISHYEAVYAYTMGGALLSGDDTIIGSISPGKWADLIVLNGDPLKTPPGKMRHLSVDQTYIAGQLVYSKIEDL